MNDQELIIEIRQAQDELHLLDQQIQVLGEEIEVRRVKMSEASRRALDLQARLNALVMVPVRHAFI